ncbi:MAG: hypothetical protein JKY65_13045 [Planctomycetes bacterium]|nr:hypothetical protein [Planctomycetota bacterium]
MSARLFSGAAALWRPLLALLGSLILAGCGSIDAATTDHTRLWGEVPTGLGRILEVRVDEVEDDQLREDILEAVRREFVRGGLFDRVRPVFTDRPVSPGTSELRIAFAGASSEELFDLFEFEDALVSRYELSIELLDEQNKQILGGHITGLGVDVITEHDHLTDAKREDVRLASLDDAAMKMSRALRHAANTRAHKVYEVLPRIDIPGAVGIAVLGFDDSEDSARLHGLALNYQVRRLFPRLGPAWLIVKDEDVTDAMIRAEITERLFDLSPYRVEKLASFLPAASMLLVGKVEIRPEGMFVTGRLLDRSGKPIVKHEVHASGLGALPVAAAKLCRGLAEKLRTLREKK